MAGRFVASSLMLLLGCGAKPAPTPSPAHARHDTAGGAWSNIDRPRSSEPASTEDGSREAPRDPGCDDPSSAEVLVVKAGQTARTGFGIAVTYEGSEHDHYDDGGFDFIASFVFQGVMDDGSLTPSALGWRPSLVAKPRWVHLSMSLCVRLAAGNEDEVRLELYPARRE